MNDAECQQCDFERALHPARATWLCPVCNRDFSVEYVLWARAVHPEWVQQPVAEGNGSVGALTLSR